MIHCYTAMDGLKLPLSYKEMCDLKSVNDVVAHVMDEEVKDFLYGIITRSVMQRIIYSNYTLYK